MSIAITLGFQTAKRNSLPILLHCSDGKSEATEIFMNPPAGILRTELILNPSPTRRRNHIGDGTAYAESTPEDELSDGVSATQIEFLTEQLAATEKDLAKMIAQIEEKDLAAVTAEAEIKRLTTLLDGPVPKLGSAAPVETPPTEPEPLLPESAGTAKDAAKRR
jgi:hypothetical protein